MKGWKTHSWLTLVPKGVDLTLLTQTEDLSLRAEMEKKCKFLQQKISFFLFKLWSTKCTGTGKTTSVKISDLRVNAPINQFCMLAWDIQGQNRGHIGGHNLHWIIFKDWSPTTHYFTIVPLCNWLFSKYWENAVLLSQRYGQQNLTIWF